MEIRVALSKSWSLETARQWQLENPALGQCNVTAILINEIFGGEILKTNLREGFHFYNKIDGIRYDFTDSQFDTQITYEDLRSNREEAELGATQMEIECLRQAFRSHFDNYPASS